MKNRNKGFSLVELIVVIAIMAVMTGFLTISISSIGGFKAKECAANLESMLNKTRVATMGKNSVVLHIYKAADGSIMAETVTNGASTLTETIGKKSVSVKYTAGDDLTSMTELDATGFYVQYNRSSGALKVPTSDPKILVHYITVSQGSRTITITIYPETGKVKLG